jgi:hypothetical protein
MIIVHNIFVCKPGNASKLAVLFKEWAELEKKEGGNTYIMTDMTGQFHRVISVSTYDSLADYEKSSEKMGESPEQKKLMEKFKDVNEMYHSGLREIYKVW